MKKKLTIIDIIIILCVLLAVAFAGIKFIGSSLGTETKNLTYTVLVDDCMPEVARVVAPAERILLNPAQEVYGKVTDVELKPSERYFFNSNSGQYVKQTTEERVDIYITVEAPVVEDECGYAVGDKYVRIGNLQGINGSGYSVNGYIIDIKE